MKDKKGKKAVNNPQNTPATEPIANDIDSAIDKDGKGTPKPNDSDGISKCPQPFVVKMEKTKGWSTAEKISLFAAVLSCISIFMTVKSFDKTSEAVKISQKSFELSEQSAQIANRAFITNPAIEIQNGIDTPIGIKATITNVGKTPAFKLVADINIAFKNSESEVDPVAITSRMDTSRAITMGTNQINFLNTYSPVPFTKADIPQFASGAVKIFVAISIKYFDIFNHPHFVHGFWQFDYNKKNFVACKKFNDSD